MVKGRHKNQIASFPFSCFFFLSFFLQYICCDCKKSFCSLCSVLQENLRICATCHLLKATAFQRPRLMRLRVRDLRQYLLLRNIPTDTCREKEDLVDLVLCHQGIEEEEDPDTGSLHSRSLYTPTPSTTQSTSELSAFVASQEEPLSRSDSSDTNQVGTGFIFDRVCYLLSLQISHFLFYHFFRFSRDLKLLIKWSFWLVLKPFFTGKIIHCYK